MQIIRFGDFFQFFLLTMRPCCALPFLHCVWLLPGPLNVALLKYSLNDRHSRKHIGPTHIETRCNSLTVAAGPGECWLNLSLPIPCCSKLRSVVRPFHRPMFVGASRSNDQTPVRAELVDAGQILADKEVACIRPLHMMRYRVSFRFLSLHS